MNARRGGQRRSEVAFLHCVSEPCAHTDVCWKAQDLVPLAPKPGEAQELWELVQRDLLKGVR